MASKRTFSEEDMDGKIVRIKLKDFLTYDDCEFQPGEKLNVILGPNGTGKSSIVCAICLGLGGSPTLLGRAKTLGDYIKHRKREALIEIELFRKNGNNLVIKRTLSTGATVSRWELNGRPSNGSAVSETVKKMNIQMDNLCQFLPQDRVNEFAKMNPQQLLIATEKAVGPDGMYDDHNRLISLRSKVAELEMTVEGRKAHKELIESNNQRLERDVMRYKEREKHQERIQILQKKRPWAEYEEARTETYAAKNAKKEVEKKIKEIRKQHNPLKEKIDKTKDALKKCEDKIKTLSADINKTGHELKKIDGNLEKQSDKIKDAKTDFATLKQEEDDRKKKILSLQTAIEALKKDFDKAPDPEELKPRLIEINGEIKTIQHHINELTKSKTEFMTENNNLKSQINGLKKKLHDVDNVDHQKLESLRKIDRDTYDAVLWLRENKAMFTGTVYEPIMTQINMHNMKNSMYIENTVSFNDMKAFVCQNREDQKKFSNQTRETLNLHVSAVCPPFDAKKQYNPAQNIEQFRQYGFKNYLTDLFTCPTTVLQYLCESYNLHNIPIGEEKIDNHLEHVINNTNFRRFYTTQNSYSISKSRYANKKSTNINLIRKDKNLLNPSVDLEVKKQLDIEVSRLQCTLKENNGSVDAISKQTNELLTSQENLRTEKKDLTSQMRRRQTINSQIESKNKRLEEERKTNFDMEKAEKQFRQKIKKINQDRVDLVTEYQSIVKRSMNIGIEHMQMNFCRIQKKHQSDSLEQEFQNVDSNLNNLVEQLENVSRGFNDAKNKAKRLLAKANELTGGTNQGDQVIIPERLKNVFETLPDSVQEIDELICEEQSRLNCQFETNPQVIKDYEKNKREISLLEKELGTKETELNEIKTSMEELLQRWLEPLEELIGRINERYSDFFRRMKCAGEVVLKKNANDDYSQFGVQINVKFRAENKLKELTSHFQSGGERSVSTMLYLISLQELTKCPFRLVDEINQGMDPNNERRVFELVVETVCRPNTSQYFLITPKLLPDLHYSEKMTILTVLNGHWMLPHSKFRLKDMIERKRLLSRGR